MWLLLSAIACNSAVEPVYPDLVPGAPIAGAAEGTLNLPVGTPMGGYSARAMYLGAETKQDNRASPYTVGFVESTGVHTRPGIKAVWLTNGDQDLVITQTDTIYSFDGLVSALTSELEARTGRPLHGKVVHTTNHSHNSYGPFSDQIHFYLGGDKFNEEIFERFVQQLADVAMAAYADREPAAIGTGWAKDWDPDDRVYHDRRGENDNLVMFDDLPPGGTGKDPYLNVIRVDAVDGTPKALLYTFGIHGTVLEGSMLSSDASGGIDMALEEQFDTPVVVMHMQSGAGDASPSGSDDGMARIETLGEYAKGAIMDLWADTPTSDAPITMETAARHIWQHRDLLTVHRGDKVLEYHPYESDMNWASDEKVYEDDGSIATPIDEFNAEFGAAFCGSDTPLISAGFIGSNTYPYSSCTDVGLVSRIVYAIFEVSDVDYPLPFNESMKAGTLATKIGPIPTLMPDGTTVTQPLFAGFFPAEPTSMFTEQWRRRVKSQLGYDMPLIIGYSQDHEGYFLPPEDWLMGGYEPNIAIWGPLQGEHVMEGVLDYSQELLSTDDVAEDPDPSGYYAPTTYASHELPTAYLPDLTPDAGTIVHADAAPEYLWVPADVGFVAEYEVPDQVPRVQGVVQLVWKGGDAMVDEPVITLQRQEGSDWVPVTTRSGRTVTDRYTDIIVGWTPDPLYPAEADQTHYWWAAFQVVNHIDDKTALPLGTYRLHVDGVRYTGGSTHWPWATAPYTVDGDPFEVVPAAITLTADVDGVWASIAGPADGWRLVDLEGYSKGDNPVRGDVTVDSTVGDAISSVTLAADRIEGGRAHVPLDLSSVCRVTVTDAAGNTGSLDLADCGGI
jgi:neutral ceramidase